VAKTANNADLKAAIQQHLEETKGQVNRLERVFEAIGEKARGKKCDGMAGLIDEAKEMMEEDAEPDVLDAGIIAGSQKIEHYEIATYGCLCTWAKQLELDEAAELLGQNLEEEKAADAKLTELAESHINAEASSGE
jgi:ferritin-like metal-binding protein YciE